MRFPHRHKENKMAHQDTAATEEPAPGEPTAETTDTGISAEVQALIDAELERFAAAHGIQVPPVEAPAAQPSALDALATDVEHTTFAEKVAHLAENGYQAAVTAEQESPTLKTLVTIVGELAAKLA